MEIVTAGKPFASLRAARGKGDQGPMAQSELCSQIDCSKEVVTSLGKRELCFDHFCERCYEVLEHADRAKTYTPRSAMACVELAHQLDECARRALEISLSEIELSNLDRARLLDIVLWSGDLTNLLRRKHNASSKALGEERRPEELQNTSGSRVN